MSRCNGSLAVSTYQAGRVLMVGWNGQQVSLLPRRFEKPMGLDIRGRRMALATANNVMLFQDDAVLAHHFSDDQPGRYDAIYLPRLSYHTADILAHDLCLTDSEVWLVNTRFNCLCVMDESYSFVPRWRPSFITDYVAEDRCHLNGLAMVDDVPGFATALAESNVDGGWRDHKVDGGIVMNVQTQNVILRGLAMPHSPRWHDGSLWVLNSGGGELLRVDPLNGRHDVVCELPGYLRGLEFCGHHALIGLCRIRESRVFGGMPVQEKYEHLKCGVMVVDTRNGRQTGFLEMTSGCTEIYDIQLIPERRRVNILNVGHEQASRAFSGPENIHYWMRSVPNKDDKDQ